MRGAVAHSVLGLEHRYDLGVFGQAAGVNQLDPLTDRFPIVGFNIADLGRDTLFHAGHGHCPSADWSTEALFDTATQLSGLGVIVCRVTGHRSSTGHWVYIAAPTSPL